MRHITLLMAFGKTLRASAVSPAATPTVDARVGKYDALHDQHGRQDAVREDPAVIRDKVKPRHLPGDRMAARKNTAPTARNTASVPTLTSENQNSISPNTFTPIMFITDTIPSAPSANTTAARP